MSETKGKAQVWLHSKPDYISEKLDDLFAEMHMVSLKEKKISYADCLC